MSEDSTDALPYRRLVDQRRGATVIDYRVCQPDTNQDLDENLNDELNDLFATSWPNHVRRDLTPQLARSLAYVCAYADSRLVGFVNLTWDGGAHAFVLDTTVHPDLRRRGIGRRLVAEAVAVARRNGIEWVHVDYEPRLGEFYRACGFRPTEAGLIQLTPDDGQ